ncbi:hypothetical protein K469DRAFT_715249 [Zopfia rhizophila CBS 207.26]|uniref:Uncharacterized protein n=1 Tax=Zopfia rhizophila CBS 207.26 TaxID=1314779 RepID=A0A6A6ENR3_9PEZI|nr:hypothetical protein K469DRAFT_715249 [Zopfia rhizophila CBS 207.26]
MHQHICGDTDLWKGCGEYGEHGSCLSWSTWGEGNTQPVCWDAIENILNQCYPEASPMNYKYEACWELDAKRYDVVECCYE